MVALMRPEEAEWIGRQLAALTRAEDISPVLELGAATRHYRTVISPHIDRHLHAPLRERGAHIVCSDIKEGDGVDVWGDIYDPEVRKQLRAVGAKTLLCCNMFEHVVDRPRLAGICDDLLEPGGLLVVTVPHSYPYHRDPIDTYFRPTPGEIAAMFPDYGMVRAEIIESTTWLDDVFRTEPRPVWAVTKKLIGTAIMAGGLDDTKARAHCLLWSFRPYKVSAAILRKPA